MTGPPGSVVVVGGGIAGFSTCAELRRRGYDGTLSLLDSGDLLHDRPPLSKDYLLGMSDDAAIALQDEAWFAEQGIDVTTSARVVALRTDPPGVTTGDGTVLGAEVVVLALGGEARPLRVPGADHPAVHLLRRVEDARRLRRVLLPGARVLVVGAGLIGAEVASTAMTLGAQVTLIDPLATPLADTLGLQIAQRLHAEHRRRGITVLQGAVARLDDEGGSLRAQLMSGSGNALAHTVVADVVVVGIGMTPTTGLAAAAGLVIDRGILVDDSQRTSAPDIYAVGDCSRQVAAAGLPLPTEEHWDAALRGGQVAAAAILGQPPPPASAPWFWTDRHGEHVEVVGRFSAGTRTVVRGDVTAGPFLAFALVGDLVVGAVSVDEPQGMRAARRLIDRRVPVDAAVLADPSTELRRLLRS